MGVGGWSCITVARGTQHPRRDHAGEEEGEPPEGVLVNKEPGRWGVGAGVRTEEGVEGVGRGDALSQYIRNKGSQVTQCL